MVKEEAKWFNFRTDSHSIAESSQIRPCGRRLSAVAEPRVRYGTCAYVVVWDVARKRHFVLGRGVKDIAGEKDEEKIMKR